MMLPVTCPHCQRIGRAPEETAGRTATCPGCRQPFTVPFAPPEVAEAMVVSEAPAQSGRHAPQSDDDAAAAASRASRHQDRVAGIVVRAAGWIICSMVCLGATCNFHSLITEHMSAVQQAGAAGSALVTMALAFILARALDGATRTR